MKQAVEFQRVVWGSDFSDITPAAVFWFASRIGGILAGAFDGVGEMIGLLFGMTGWDGARPVHWSDLLAVHPSARGKGVGLALKRYQRDTLLAQGVTLVHWTFDPLESRNAHLNFARLGVTSREYIRDAYGASASPLHRGIGTDRLVVRWELDSGRVRHRMDKEDRPPAAVTAPFINPPGEAPRLDLEDERVALRVPGEIQELKSRDAVAARRWRDQTRAGFEAYFGRGYEAVEVVRGEEESAYVLSRTSGAG